MKKYSIIIISLFFISCSSSKRIENKIITKIINDIINHELEKDNYAPHGNSDIILIENPVKSLEVLKSYEHAYDYNKEIDGKETGWILNKKQISELKEKYKNEKIKKWKKTDFENKKIAIITYDNYKNNMISGYYLHPQMQEKIVLFISKPILLENDCALMLYHSSSTILGSTIERFNALVKKVNGKWIIIDYYNDDVYY